MTRIRRRVGLPLSVAAMLGTSACDDFLEVRSPTELEAEGVDPVRDGPVFAASAFQNFAEAYGVQIVYIAWWSHEARVGDTFPTRNEFGRRFIDDRNGTLGSDVWTSIARAAATGDEAVELLLDAEGRDIPLAQAALAQGFSLVLMAETFCQGAVRGGPPLDTQAMLDLAIERFELARERAGAQTGSTAEDIVDAANVGIARAHLQAGRKAEAAAAARLVEDEDFTFMVNYEDIPSNRDRLGNTVWSFTTARPSLVVPPMHRQWADDGDTRIAYDDAGRVAQDGELRFYRQQKYTNWDSPVRLASYLEARYIEMEAAGTPEERVAFINERRAVGGQGAFSSSDPDEILAELMEQRSRDFWLEGKRMGDYRRNPGYVPGVLEPTDEYYKPGVGSVGDQMCWPIPDDEFLFNENW